MKAIGYVRVSTEGQAVDGVSLDAQRARIAAWCDANGYELAAVHVDAGISAKRADNRPGLQAALAEVCKERGALVVYSLSRLARSTKDAIGISERLEKAGADLVSLSERIDTTSAAGKMVFRMLAVLAEFERDLVSERTTAAMAHLRQQSKRVSRHMPFGYDLAADGESLTENAREQEAIRMMRDLRADGKSLRDIARTLESQGIVAKNGGAWSAKVINGILERKAV
ncbi:MAG TPA: recombinase family protein [Candidatus Hydrogenedentes bacterium]|nr:recombinase family protein [Candidatus Hydrogenedentota bacterium]HPC16863.1 recombinase family protein [Candidatus Hydrogenedentota bacterium]HPC16870.1 recombinase family protein [Candidatus Hydrogenedentota bacterium]HRT22152.1 recombinase family protein [Candidatus Hydrogenedentota bacterium]HRT22159.1 recombinase family protein [Candidatus Hydrogenedentota bacterium]